MKAFILSLTICLTSVLYAQTNTNNGAANKEALIYHPEENASAAIADAVKKAELEKKQVFIQLEVTGVAGVLNLTVLPMLIRKLIHCLRLTILCITLTIVKKIKTKRFLNNTNFHNVLAFRYF